MYEELTQKYSILKSETIANDILKLYVKPNQIKSVLSDLKNIAELSFDILISLVAADKNSFFELSYILFSTTTNNDLIIATEISKDNPLTDSVCDIYKSANWDEREIFDLFGIKFNAHPNLKRILLPKGWIGYPLRKDYVMNDARLNWNK